MVFHDSGIQGPRPGPFNHLNYGLKEHGAHLFPAAQASSERDTAVRSHSVFWVNQRMKQRFLLELLEGTPRTCASSVKSYPARHPFSTHRFSDYMPSSPLSVQHKCSLNQSYNCSQIFSIRTPPVPALARISDIRPPPVLTLALHA